MEILKETLHAYARDFIIISGTLAIFAGFFYLMPTAQAKHYEGLPEQARNEQGGVLLTFTQDIDPLDKLAKAVALHETKDCTLGYGKTHFNCMGVKKYRNGKLQMARYKSKKEAYEDFKEIWGRMYGTTVPTMENAVRWSGNDRATAWYKNVNYFLNTI